MYNRVGERLRLVQTDPDPNATPVHRRTLLTDFTWSVRVRAAGKQEATVHSRNHTFRVGPQLSFAQSDSNPTALEFFIGAFAADIVNGFQRAAAKRRIALDELEFSVTCRLNNPLVHVEVIGEEGHPGIEQIDGTLYVFADSEPNVIEELWNETLSMSPLVTTLKDSVTLMLRINMI